MKDALKLISEKGKEIIELEQEREALKEDNTSVEKFSENGFQIKIGPPLFVLETRLKNQQAKLDDMKLTPKKLKNIILSTTAIMLATLAATIFLSSILTGIISIVLGSIMLFKVCKLLKNTPEAMRKLQDNINETREEIDKIKSEQQRVRAKTNRLYEINSRISHLISEITNEILNFTEIGNQISLDFISERPTDDDYIGTISCSRFLFSGINHINDDIAAKVKVNQLTNHN